MSKNHNPASCRSKILKPMIQRQNSLRKQEICSPEIKASFSRKHQTCIFAIGRKRKNIFFCIQLIFSKVIMQSFIGRISFREYPDIAAHDGIDMIQICVFQRNHILDLHGSLGQGSGLIQAEYIDSGQRFNGIKILDQYMVPAQPDRADC